MSIVEYAHVSLSPEGVPVISDTRTKVVEVVVEHLAYGWEARELHEQHPHLSLGQIHSALAYYYDHQSEMEADIQRRLGTAEQVKADLERIHGEPPLITKLKATGQLR
jgi:uncharacterized protein (DUF433 family)